jgi:hypothetical protein
MSNLVGRLSLDLRHSLVEDMAYDSLTEVDCDILLDKRKIGIIQATIIYREKILDGCFYSAINEHSADLQWVGCALFEPRRGRTKLVSLADYDMTEFDTMYISTFTIDKEFKEGGKSDVGAQALRMFLHHPYISDADRLQGYWRVCSAVFVLSSTAYMSDDERAAYQKQRETRRRSPIEDSYKPPTDEELRKEEADTRRRKELERLDANAFLRNGFFQDPALVRKGEDRLLVATYGQWTKPLLSHDEVSGIKLLAVAPNPAEPRGKDADIKFAIERQISRSLPPRPDFCQELETLLRQGGSLARSSAMHIACGHNAVEFVQYFMRLDRTIHSARDDANVTPLMVAAACAAGRQALGGISETQVIDMLLAAGARKDDVDSQNLTAYGHFRKAISEFQTMLTAMCGAPLLPGHGQYGQHSPVTAVFTKLMPPGGPTAADWTGGVTMVDEGFMDYTEDDREFDEMMQRDYSSEELEDY